GVIYTPAANYYGPDSFSYSITDPTGLTATTTVNVTVSAIEDAPVAVNDSAAASEDSSGNGINVLANDSDADNLSGPANGGLIVTGVSAPSHGATSFTSTGIIYAPAANYYGSDSFSYTITDSTGLTSVATVNVTVSGIDDAPVAVG